MAKGKGRKGQVGATGTAQQTTGGPADVKSTGGTNGPTLLDMEQAITLLKTTRPTFYRWVRQGKLKGMKLGRQWRFYKTEIERFLKGEEPRIELRVGIDPLFEQLAQRFAKAGGEKVTLTKDGTEVTQTLHLMMRLGMKLQATDINIECFPRGSEDVGVIRHRIDGILHLTAQFDKRLQASLIEGLKALVACDVNERRRPQDGRYATTLSGKPIVVRASFLPGVMGESATAIILGQQPAMSFELDRLGFAPADVKKFDAALRLPFGLIHITSPTGHGRTTTQYACLVRLAAESVKIISIEDPVEMMLDGVTQVQISPRDNYTFPVVMRSALRSAANVIMAAELRDSESAALALMMARTGHLVITGGHQLDAARGLTGLVTLAHDAMAANLAAEGVRLVTAQRLALRNCPNCLRKDETPDAAQLHSVVEAARKGGFEFDASAAKLMRGAGCEMCNQVGMRGRVLVGEVMPMSTEIATALQRGASADEIRMIAVGQGMKTLAAEAARRMTEGEIPLQEVVRVIAGL